MRVRLNAPFDRLRAAVPHADRLVLVALAAWLAAVHASPALGGPQHAPPAAAPQQAAQTPPDGVTRLLQKLEEVVRSGDARGYLGLISPDANPFSAAAFAQSIVRPGATRVAVRERDRAREAGAPPSAGLRLMAEVFVEFGRRARLAAVQLDVVPKGPVEGGEQHWAIKAQDVLSSFGPFYNLALGPREYVAKDLAIAGQDFELRLPEGSVFTADTDEGPTVLLLLGRGQMLFRPAPATEREQLRIFAGSDALDTSFTAAFVRLSPFAVERAKARGTMVERPPDADHARDAAALFRADNRKSFSVGLGDLSSEEWSLVPVAGDIVADVHTKRYGVLTYARSSHEAEDISLFDRARKVNISVYASPQKLAERGRFYDDDEGEDYEVIHYDVEASFDPVRQMIDGSASLTIRVRAPSTTTLTLRLAETLGIQAVRSREFGRLVPIRIRNQNSFIVNLPAPVTKDTILGFTIPYSGRVAPQMIDRETVSVDTRADEGQEVQDESPAMLLEPSYLYTSGSYWYPQGASSSFATARLRVKVPPTYACVASGDPNVANGDAMLRSATSGCDLEFRALQPIRYLSVLITRLTPVRSVVAGATIANTTPAGDAVPRAGVFYHDVEVNMFSSPRMRGRAAAMVDRASDIVRFYSTLVGDCPYPTLTLAIVERELPGGHSPGYVSILSQPIPSSRYNWRSDPASFADFPEFFLAHEIAHQWWGQAVGWKNYHERWLSDGLAQYFAALYAQKFRGPGVFDSVLERMQDWAVKKSDEGPVYLGYRIGHVKRDPQLFRAIVYNKSAVVLNMLRRLLGDDAFFRGVRRFYHEWRFRKAGSDDLRRAFEAESHRSLERFFDRWIYDSRVPRLRFSSKTTREADGRESLLVRFEQTGDVFDVPVTVTLNYADRASVDVVVPVTDAVTEMRVPLAGKLRNVEVNRDHAAIARIEK